MSAELWSRPRVRLALAALAAAVAVAAWAAARALTLDAVVPRAPEPIAAIAAAAAAGPTLSAAQIADAVDVDPFHPERRRPGTRYRIAVPAGDGAEGPAAPPATAPASAGAPVRVVGVVVSPDGESFAVCQIGNEPARIVRPGQSIGAYRLRAVTQGSATFISTRGDTLTVRVARSGG